MGRVSKLVINKEILIQIEDQFSYLILNLDHKSKINAFINEFLTSEEKIMLGKRLILYMMLYKDFTSKKIHDSLGMSYETIHWYKQIYNNKSEVFRKNIQSLISKENNRQLWEKIEKILEPLELALNSKTNMRARAKLLSGDYGDK